VSEETREQFAIVKRLINDRGPCGERSCARPTPGAKAELIFRYIYAAAGLHEAGLKRLWISSLTPGGPSARASRACGPPATSTRWPNAAQRGAPGADWLVGDEPLGAPPPSLRVSCSRWGRVQNAHPWALLVERESGRSVRSCPRTTWRFVATFVPTNVRGGPQRPASAPWSPYPGTLVPRGQNPPPRRAACPRTARRAAGGGGSRAAGRRGSWNRSRRRPRRLPPPTPLRPHRAAAATPTGSTACRARPEPWRPRRPSTSGTS